MEITKRNFEEMREGIRDDMTNLVNKKGVGGNAFHTNDILEAIQQITSRVKYLLESTEIIIMSTNK